MYAVNRFVADGMCVSEQGNVALVFFRRAYKSVKRRFDGQAMTVTEKKSMSAVFENDFRRVCFEKIVVSADGANGFVKEKAAQMLGIVGNISEVNNSVARLFAYNLVHGLGVSVRIGKNKIFQSRTP